MLENIYSKAASDGWWLAVVCVVRSSADDVV